MIPPKEQEQEYTIHLGSQNQILDLGVSGDRVQNGSDTLKLTNFGQIPGFDRFGPVLYRISHFDIMQSRPFGGIQGGQGGPRMVQKGSKMGYPEGSNLGSQNGSF